MTDQRDAARIDHEIVEMLRLLDCTPGTRHR